MLSHAWMRRTAFGDGAREIDSSGALTVSGMRSWQDLPALAAERRRRGYTGSEPRTISRENAPRGFADAIGVQSRSGAVCAGCRIRGAPVDNLQAPLLSRYSGVLARLAWHEARQGRGTDGSTGQI
jgi:hypothetical protein